MANEYVLCDKEDLVAIANAVRANSGTSQTFSVSELKEAAIANMGTNTQDMVAVYNEINLKTGLSDCDTIEQALLDITTLSSHFNLNEVPSYVQTEAKRVANVVSALQNENTLSFICLSDTHRGNGSTDIGLTHAASAARIIKGLIPIDFVAHLGDIVPGGVNDNLESHLLHHKLAMRDLSIISPELRLVGNHDANPYNKSAYLTADDVYRRVGRYSINKVPPSSEQERGYFYVDFDNKKTRVICLNSADMKDADINALIGVQADGHHISAKQFQWLVSALDTTGKNDWRVIVLSHHPLHWYGSMPNVLSILEAYISGTSGSITADNVNVTYNFSGKNAAKLVGTFHGHTHNFINGKVGSKEIVRVGTPNGCYGGNNSYGSSSYNEDFRSKYGETITYNKTSNSAKDTAFCVYTLDFDKEVIYATCYGAGYDRTISYGAASWYTIKYNLTSVAIDNSIASIESGTSYVANLSVSNNYSINNVIVTMGGTDITSSVYSNGKINISKVTGNVVITATATGFTNVIDIIGYDNQKRLSTSTGELRDAPDYVTTGFIDLTHLPDSEHFYIRTRGVDFRYSEHDLCAAVSYDANKAFTWSTYLNVYSGDDYNSTFDENGNAVLRFRKTSARDYMKICGYGKGENLIVTVNEEIVEVAPDTPQPDKPITNIIDTIGYTDNIRLSTSDGISVRDQVGYTTTGLIDVSGYGNGTTIRTKGVNFASSVYSHAYRYCYKADGSFYNAYQIATTTSTIIPVTLDDEGNLTIVFADMSQVDPNMLRFRLVGYGSGKDLIITINEEIPENLPDAPAAGYTNLVSTSLNADGTPFENGKGYKEGYRISSSSGNESQLDGAIVTGFIPYSGQVVRIYGSTATSGANATGQYLCLYDSNHTRLQVYQANWTGVGVENVDGKWLFTFDPAAMSNAQTYFDRTAYIRVSLAACTSSDLVVTFDEEIA